MLESAGNRVKVSHAPLITGSINGWETEKMTELTELIQRLALINDVRSEVEKIEGVSTTQKFGQHFV
jgi:hypothetical protein